MVAVHLTSIRWWRVAAWSLAVLLVDACAVVRAVTTWAPEAVDAALVHIDPEEGS